MSALGEEARRFCRRQGHGVLSTLSQRLAGYPFGSVSPFILDHAGCPVILISDLAEHTRNIAGDPRVSLIVQPFSQDMQATARLTLVGEARRLPDKDALGPRYLRYFPQAEAYFDMHDFNFYRITPRRVRWIGGFGKVHWLEPEAYLSEAEGLEEEESALIGRLQREPASSLLAYARCLGVTAPAQVALLGVDPDGFDARVDGVLMRGEFPVPARDAAALRAAFVSFLQQCNP